MVQLPTHAARDLDEQGFFVTEPLFDEPTLREVRAEIERLWDEQRRRAPGSSRKDLFTQLRPELQRLHRSSDVLAAFCRHEAFTELARVLLGDDADLFWNQSYVKAPDPHGLTAIPWHQDAYYATIDARAYNCWVAVTRTTVANGTVLRAPLPAGGTLLPHRWDEALLFFACDIDERQAVPIVLEPGQVFVYDGRLPHRSGRNVSDELRIAYSVAFTRAGARLCANGEAFGDRVPILRGGLRADVMLREHLAGARDDAHPGARLLAEIAARVPDRAGSLATLLATYHDAVQAGASARAEAILGQLLALVPDDEEVLGDNLRARTRTEQLLDEYHRARATDRRSARLLLQRILELEPGHAIATAELAALRERGEGR
jgi:ectoine hydroxylase-related dioxygenase (phytanoyl-CoA dioxygenase family)